MFLNDHINHQEEEASELVLMEYNINSTDKIVNNQLRIIHNEDKIIELQLHILNEHEKILNILGNHTKSTH